MGPLRSKPQRHLMLGPLAVEENVGRAFLGRGDADLLLMGQVGQIPLATGSQNPVRGDGADGGGAGVVEEKAVHPLRMEPGKGGVSGM